MDIVPFFSVVFQDTSDVLEEHIAFCTAGQARFSISVLKGLI